MPRKSRIRRKGNRRRTIRRKKIRGGVGEIECPFHTLYAKSSLEPSDIGPIQLEGVKDLRGELSYYDVYNVADDGTRQKLGEIFPISIHNNRTNLRGRREIPRSLVDGDFELLSYEYLGPEGHDEGKHNYLITIKKQA
jgi:hypothetical protein